MKRLHRTHAWPFGAFLAMTTLVAQEAQAQSNIEVDGELVCQPSADLLRQDADLLRLVPKGPIVAPGARLIDDYPCKGCYFQLPKDHDPEKPAPLWIALHGDEGNARYTHMAHSQAMSEAGYILVSLQCPQELGCNPETPTWYDWSEQSTHDPEWVNKQREAIEKDYKVDSDRMYLSGFSAGSMYLSFWALDNSTKYAGVIYETCGYYGHGSECTAQCKIPAYFLEGSEDFCLSQGEKQMEYMKACMHELVWDVVEGEEHSIIQKKLPEVLAWTNDHPLNCGGDDDDDDETTSEGTSDEGESSDDDDDSSNTSETGGDDDDDGDSNATESGDGDDDDDDDDDDTSTATQSSNDDDDDDDTDENDDDDDDTDVNSASDDGDEASQDDDENSGAENEGNADRGCAMTHSGGTRSAMFLLVGLLGLRYRSRREH